MYGAVPMFADNDTQPGYVLRVNPKSQIPTCFDSVMTSMFCGFTSCSETFHKI